MGREPGLVPTADGDPGLKKAKAGQEIDQVLPLGREILRQDRVRVLLFLTFIGALHENWKTVDQHMVALRIMAQHVLASALKQGRLASSHDRAVRYPARGDGRKDGSRARVALEV